MLNSQAGWALAGEARDQAVTAEADEIECAIVQWLKNYMGNLFNVPPNQVDASLRFQQYGLDSSAAVALSADLGDWLRCGVDPAVAYDHPSIGELAKALGADAAVQKAFIRRHPGASDTRDAQT